MRERDTQDILTVAVFALMCAIAMWALVMHAAGDCRKCHSTAFEVIR